MVQIFNSLIETARDASGAAIEGALLFIYEAGTTTKLTVYTDSALTTPATNPLVADSEGRFATIYGNADDYKFVLAPADDTDPPTSPIKTVDDYSISAASSFSGGINVGGFTEHLSNAQTGTSYTILTGDRAKNLTLSNANPVAVTLPQANSSTFPDGWYVLVANKGVGLVTITPTTSTINGGASITLLTNQSCFIISDGTNYISNYLSLGGFSTDGRGSIPVQNGDDNNIELLPQGTAGEVLVSNGANALPTFSAVLPIGTIIDYGGTTLQDNYLACDGAAVSRTTYAALFTAIGTTWGVGDGSTTFNVPSLARRTTVGSGGSGTGTLGNTVGSTGGAENHSLTSSENGPHTHSYTAIPTGIFGGGSGGNTSNPTSQTTSSSGSGSAHNNMQPSAVTFKQIRYQ